MSSTISIPLRTAGEVRSEFERLGISISEWALANRVSAPLAYQVLSGKKRCVRGQCHDIAVLLGLKVGEVRSSANLKSVFGQSDEADMH